MSGKSWFDWLLGGASAAAEITSTMVSNGNVLMTALNNLQNEETCFDKDFIAAFHHSCLARQTSIEGCVNKLKEKKYNDSLSDEEEKEFITQSALLSLLKGFDEIFEKNFNH